MDASNPRKAACLGWTSVPVSERRGCRHPASSLARKWRRWHHRTTGSIALLAASREIDVVRHCAVRLEDTAGLRLRPAASFALIAALGPISEGGTPVFAPKVRPGPLSVCFFIVSGVLMTENARCGRITRAGIAQGRGFWLCQELIV